MTNISIGRKDNRYHIEATGHAEGSEIVCACVSYTMYSLLAYLKNYPLNILLEEMDDGYTKIEWEDDNDSIYEYIYLSLMQLSANYPRYVRLKNIHFFDKE